MKEIKIEGIVIQWHENKTIGGPSYYTISIPYSKNLIGNTLYFKNYEGRIEKTDVDKCAATLFKSASLLPRSIYPLLTKGYMVMMNPGSIFDTYKIIKEYIELERFVLE